MYDKNLIEWLVFDAEYKNSDQILRVQKECGFRLGLLTTEIDQGFK